MTKGKRLRKIIEELKTLEHECGEADEEQAQDVIGDAVFELEQAISYLGEDV